MGIVLDKTLSDSVSGELQACSLWPNDTARVKKMFCEYRRKRVRGARFGFRMDKQQLVEWVGCDINSSAKLVLTLPYLTLHPCSCHCCPCRI